MNKFEIYLSVPNIDDFEESSEIHKFLCDPKGVINVDDKFFFLPKGYTLKSILRNKHILMIQECIDADRNTIYSRGINDEIYNERKRCYKILNQIN